MSALDSAAVAISLAESGELEAVLALLRANGLPEAGLADHLAMTLVARAGGEIVGSAALEVYGSSALLRSVSVHPLWQKRGLGGRLTQAALALARQQGITAVYLLTETAHQYFPRFGFEIVSRAAVPEAVRESVEFTTACPQSATAMMTRLQAG